MKHFFSENKSFLLPYFLFFAGFGVAILVYDKAELHLLLNSFHTPQLDVIFKVITNTGEWIPYIVVFGLLFYKVGYGLFLLIGQLAAGAITQIIKHLVNAPRPKLYFLENGSYDLLPLVEGVRLHSSHSFPSGHTTAIFAMFFALALMTKNKTLKFIYLLLAIVCAFSRIYLSQHFPIDVLGGSLIAVLTIGALYFWSFPLRQTCSNQSIQKLWKKK